MNIFNRVFAIVFLLGLIGALALAIFQPMASLGALRVGLDNLQGFMVANLFIYWTVAGLLLFLALLVLFLEMRRPRRLTVQVQQASGGIVELSTESVAKSLEYHVGQVPGVNRITPEVVSRGKSVRVALDVEMDPQADVPGKSEEIVQLVREIIEGKLGLKLAAVRVNMRQAPYRQEGYSTAFRGTKETPPAEEALPTPGKAVDSQG